MELDVPISTDVSQHIYEFRHDMRILLLVDGDVGWVYVVDEQVFGSRRWIKAARRMKLESSFRLAIRLIGSPVDCEKLS